MIIIFWYGEIVIVGNSSHSFVSSLPVNYLSQQFILTNSLTTNSPLRWCFYDPRIIDAKRRLLIGPLLLLPAEIGGCSQLKFLTIEDASMRSLPQGILFYSILFYSILLYWMNSIRLCVLFWWFDWYPFVPLYSIIEFSQLAQLRELELDCCRFR